MFGLEITQTGKDSRVHGHKPGRTAKYTDTNSLSLQPFDVCSVCAQDATLSRSTTDASANEPKHELLYGGFPQGKLYPSREVVAPGIF